MRIAQAAFFKRFHSVFKPKFPNPNDFGVHCVYLKYDTSLTSRPPAPHLRPVSTPLSPPARKLEFGRASISALFLVGRVGVETQASRRCDVSLLRRVFFVAPRSPFGAHAAASGLNYNQSVFIDRKCILEHLAKQSHSCVEIESTTTAIAEERETCSRTTRPIRVSPTPLHSRLHFPIETCT